MPAATTSLSVTTSDGLSIEAELRHDGATTAGAVLCHPHPQYGGDMHAGLIGVLFDTLPAAGVATLRFNFRGAGSSEGSFDGGRGERLDAAAAVHALMDTVGDVPVWLVGWSFGADVALATDVDGLAGWVVVAPPLRLVEPAEMVAPSDTRPTHLLVPEHDDYRPPASAREAVAAWSVAPSLEVLDGADHFLMGHAAVAADRIAEIITT